MTSAGQADPTRNDQSIYEDAAADWWSDDKRWVRTLKNMVPGRLNYFDQFTDWSEKAVLDVGCAGGFMTEALAQRGAQAVGIDPCEEAIAAARDHAKAGGHDIQYDVGKGEHLPYDAQQFDVVVCVDVLEHVDDVVKTLTEIHRVLKPHGLFCFDTINRNWLSKLATITIAEDLLGLLPQGTHDPALYITPDELTQMMEAIGFIIGRLTGLGPRGLDRNLDPTFGRLPTTSIIYMGTARKISS